MKIFLIVFIICLCSILLTDTTIPGGDVFGIWTVEGSPYLIFDEISIPNGESLIIEPGSVVEFQGHYKFNVQGQILATGTQQDSIFFIAADPSEGWHGLRFIDTSSDNDSSMIKYCSIKHGKGIGDDEFDSFGGALFIKNFDKLEISHSTISENSAVMGAGINCYNSSPLIDNNLISNNFALEIEPGSGSGSGIFASYNSSPIISNNVIRNNVAYSAPALRCCSNSLIINNQIEDNFGIMSAGILINSGNSILINNLISNNSADFWAGGIDCEHGASPTIINNTIVNNSAVYGGGLMCSAEASPQLYNNILWGNQASAGNQVYLYDQTSCPDFFNCNIEGGIDDFESYEVMTFDGEYVNCIDSDPLFSESEDYPFSLSEISPCIDVGTSDTTGLNLPIFDIIGNYRIWDGDNDGVATIDIGAYEYGAPLVGTSENIEHFPYFVLNQNYPNPFNPSTTISFISTKKSYINLSIFNIKGQMINTLAKGTYDIGYHSFEWDGKDQNYNDVSSGIYFYKLTINNEIEHVMKCLMVK